MAYGEISIIKNYGKENSVYENRQREEHARDSWESEADYQKDLSDSIDKLYEALTPYLVLARLFKPFLMPLVRKWINLRKDLSDTPLLEWARTGETSIEQMRANNTSFVRLELLMRHIGLFNADLALQSPTIYSECVRRAQTSGRYTQECILEMERVQFSLPGFSVIEKMQLISSERVIDILERLGEVLYGNN